MVDRQIKAAAAGGLHTAHCARLARRQGPPALTPVEPATLLGADPPRDDRIYRSTIYTRTVRANVTTSMSRPPARLSAVAPAETVAPVVYTSSTRITCRGVLATATKAPRAFFRRSAR